MTSVTFQKQDAKERIIELLAEIIENADHDYVTELALGLARGVCNRMTLGHLERWRDQLQVLAAAKRRDTDE